MASDEAAMSAAPWGWEDIRRLPMHRGSHSGYSKMAREVANREWEALMASFLDESLVPGERLTEAALRVQSQMRRSFADGSVPADGSGRLR